MNLKVTFIRESSLRRGEQGGEEKTVRLKVLSVKGVLYLVELRVEKSQENQNEYAEEGESPEGQVAYKNQRRSGGHVSTGIDIKKPDAPGNEEYQP